MNADLIFLLVLLGLLGGCAGTVSDGEQAARERVTEVGNQLRPADGGPALPALQADSSLDTYLIYAVLNHPAVAAAYYEWRASVEDIAPARSQPDPQFTFEADISDTLMTLMPGLMFDFMAPGKRAAMGQEAAAGSRVAYQNYVATVMITATSLRKAWIELAFVEEALRLREASQAATRQSLALSSAAYTTGIGMATLADQLSSLNLLGQLSTEIDSLKHRQSALRTGFKTALGLLPTDDDPPFPASGLSASTLPSEEELWQLALAANPGIAAMRAMVEMAVAGIEVAETAGTPGFSLGGMADLKADPLMFRPVATVTLPVWRDRIAATVAAATARHDAALARLNAEQLEVAADLARMFHMVRESDRMLAYIDDTALPNVERLLYSAAAGLQTGMSSAGEIPANRLIALDMKLQRLGVLHQRELAVTDISLMVATVAPVNTPLASTGTRQ